MEFELGFAPLATDHDRLSLRRRALLNALFHQASRIRGTSDTVCRTASALTVLSFVASAAHDRDVRWKVKSFRWQGNIVLSLPS